jgi:hypothetical protein
MSAITHTGLYTVRRSTSSSHGLLRLTGFKTTQHPNLVAKNPDNRMTAALCAAVIDA